jgi:hypothetical protein
MNKLILSSGRLVLGLAFAASAWAATATCLKDFEGIEEPQTRFIVATGKFEQDDFVNITDVGDNTVRMTLRYRADWWDGDRTTPSKDRQRAEVKGIGPHQKTGETYEYGTTWRTDPNFKGSGRFCHCFQLKATDGDNGAPLVVMSVLEGVGPAEVRYWPGDANNFRPGRKFAWKPDTWQTVKIRIKTSLQADGSVLASIDGDEFKGVTGVAVFRPDATAYRPKWGLYRGVSKGMTIGDDWVEHKNASAQKR